MILCRVKL